MKIKKTTRYAIQVLGYIYAKDGGLVTSNMISQEENIPHGVLMKVLRRLTAANLVASHQGRGKICGGFSLTNGLERMTLFQLMELMEEDICRDLERAKNSNVNSQKMLLELERIADVLQQEAEQYTLYDIITGRIETAV